MDRQMTDAQSYQYPLSTDEFLERLRDDLGDPTLNAFNLPLPQSEEEYQRTLAALKRLYGRTEQKYTAKHGERGRTK